MTQRSSCLNVRVAGCAKPHLEPGAASTCLLVECLRASRDVIVDCGHGAVPALLTCCDLRDIGAVIITHLHPDHWCDLFALKNAMLRKRIKPHSVTLHLPQGAIAQLSQICSTMGIGADYFAQFFSVAEYAAGQEIEVSGLKTSFFRTQHPVPTFGVRFEDGRSGRILTFTSDTGPFDELPDHISFSDLLIVECYSLETEGVPAAAQGHLSADTLIGLIRSAQGLRRIVISHYPFDQGSQILSRVRKALPEFTVDLATAGAIHGL